MTDPSIRVRESRDWRSKARTLLRESLSPPLGHSTGHSSTYPSKRYTIGEAVVVNVTADEPSSAWNPSAQHCCPAVLPVVRGPTWIVDCVAVHVIEMRVHAFLTAVVDPLAISAMVMRTSGDPAGT